jgi:hypothetical protein
MDGSLDGAGLISLHQATRLLPPRETDAQDYVRRDTFGRTLTAKG